MDRFNDLQQGTTGLLLLKNDKSSTERKTHINQVRLKDNVHKENISMIRSVSVIKASIIRVTCKEHEDSIFIYMNFFVHPLFVFLLAS